MSSDMPSGFSGHRSENLQGTSPLTHNWAPPEPALLEHKKGKCTLSFWKSVIRRTFVKRLSRHKGAPAPLFHDPPDNALAPGCIHIFPVILFSYSFINCPLLFDLFAEPTKDICACGKVQLNINAFNGYFILCYLYRLELTRYDYK